MQQHGLLSALVSGAYYLAKLRFGTGRTEDANRATDEGVPIRNLSQEHLADVNAPATGWTSTLMNIPVARMFDDGASGAGPRHIDPAESVAENKDPGTSGLPFQDLA